MVGQEASGNSAKALSVFREIIIDSSPGFANLRSPIWEGDFKTTHTWESKKRFPCLFRHLHARFLLNSNTHKKGAAHEAPIHDTIPASSFTCSPCGQDFEHNITLPSSQS